MDQDYPETQPELPSGDDYGSEYPYISGQPYIPRQTDGTQAATPPEHGQSDAIQAAAPPERPYIPGQYQAARTAYGIQGDYPAGSDAPTYEQPGFYANQPAYPGTLEAAPLPPGFPPPQAPRKRTKLWITLGAVGVLVVAGVLLGVFVLLPILTNSPVKTTAQQACDALKTENFHALYELYTNEMQQQINQTTVLGIPVDENAYTILMSAQIALRSGIKDCQVSDVQTSNNTAKITITFGDGTAETDPVSVVQENGTWRIQIGTGSMATYNDDAAPQAGSL